MQGTFRVGSFKFSLGSFGALRKMSDVSILQNHTFLPYFTESMVIRGAYTLLPFLPKTKHGTLKFLLTHRDRTIWGWTFQNPTPTVFIQCQSNFMRILATMVEYWLLRFLAIGQIKKKRCGTLKF